MFIKFVHAFIIFSMLLRVHYILCAQQIADGSTNGAGVLASGQPVKTVLVGAGFSNGPDVGIQSKPVKTALVKKVRDVMKKKLHVGDENDDLLDLPDVKKWFEKEYTSKKKEFNPQDTAQIESAASNLATIWCAYCQNLQRCPCIRQYCSNVTC
ncbi:uncharacterized protein LOC127832170 [Dreissena polymorpha]|uniref:uncharacterized protein LOC127832170 n=1 Tax=Dreissena polymorpha TaxID=45954 RepID=UPI002263BFE0|nr:uncharacterized protein LOC127832170 [Dreissena polymorpha]